MRRDGHGTWTEVKGGDLRPSRGVVRLATNRGCRWRAVKNLGITKLTLQLPAATKSLQAGAYSRLPAAKSLLNQLRPAIALPLALEIPHTR